MSKTQTYKGSTDWKEGYTPSEAAVRIEQAILEAIFEASSKEENTKLYVQRAIDLAGVKLAIVRIDTLLRTELDKKTRRSVVSIRESLCGPQKKTGAT